MAVRYYFNHDTEIVLTNDVDINIVQSKNPATQTAFQNQKEAIAWAEEHVKEFSETLVESSTPIQKGSEIDNIKTDLSNLKDEVDSQKALVNSLTDTIVEMTIV
jgi:hypothetical protein